MQKLQDTDERNSRWHKQMERYTIFLDQKNQYCENDYTTQSNLQIQCNSYQTTRAIFQKIEHKFLQFLGGNTKDSK